MTQLQHKALTRIAFIFGTLSLQDLKREEGQTLVEYALILAGIALLVGTAAMALGGTLKGMFQSVGNSI